MQFTKVEEKNGEYLYMYFVDEQKQKQGELFCYKTEGKLPVSENLFFTEDYVDGEFKRRTWVKLPEKNII